MKNLANYLDDYLDEESTYFESNRQKINKIHKPTKEILENKREKNKKNKNYKK